MMDFPSFHFARVNGLLFDTLRLSRTLWEKGHFTPEQAEALADASRRYGGTISRSALGSDREFDESRLN
jgi:hypothetical protein